MLMCSSTPAEDDQIVARRSVQIQAERDVGAEREDERLRKEELERQRQLAIAKEAADRQRELQERLRAEREAAEEVAAAERAAAAGRAAVADLDRRARAALEAERRSLGKSFNSKVLDPLRSEEQRRLSDKEAKKKGAKGAKAKPVKLPDIAWAERKWLDDWKREHGSR